MNSIFDATTKVIIDEIVLLKFIARLKWIIFFLQFSYYAISRWNLITYDAHPVYLILIETIIYHEWHVQSARI